MDTVTILKPGKNCWRIEKATKLCFLIDAEAYFKALYESLPLAEKQIIILSWDIYSQLRLIPDHENSQELSPVLGCLLDQLARRKRRLHIYVLNWDYSLLLAASREWLPIYKLDWNTHRRVKFCLDDQYPLGSSHHQKIVVIDKHLAFVGGLDLTKGRWDTPAHKADDPRRRIADNLQENDHKIRIRPYHDVQIAVCGPIAEALNDLGQDRWERGTGKDINKVAFDESPDKQSEYWLESLPVDMENVDVAIVRTRPAYGNAKEIREIEQLYIDAIAAAQDYIYIENQFFTAPAVSQALEKRLTEKDGPEIILNLAYKTEGWLSQNSMDVMRVKLIRDLRKADHHKHFQVYYPALPEAEPMTINLHAKLMIMDDRFVRVGSANLNNRSMGLDTECDLAVEARAGEKETQQAIRQFRNRLLAEHLACSITDIDDAIRNEGSVIRGIETLRVNPRRLDPLEPHLVSPDERDLHDIELTDPERPINSEALIKHFISRREINPARYRMAGWLTMILCLVGISIAWRYSPLGDWLSVESLTNLFTQWRDAWFSPFLFLSAFVIGGLLVVPVTLMIVIAVLVFGPIPGFIYALFASVLSAMCGYGIGIKLGRNAIRQLAGKRLNHISQKLAKRGMLTVLAVRIIPVAPFTIINLVAGASHIRARDFFLGTLIGMFPGILGITLLTDRIEATLRSPDWKTLLTLVIVAIIILSIGALLSRQLQQQNSMQKTE